MNYNEENLIFILVIDNFVLYFFFFLLYWRKRNWKNWTTMVTVRMWVEHVSLKWANGRWKSGTKVLIQKNIVALQSFIFANSVWGTQKAGRFWGDIAKSASGDILQATKFTGKNYFVKQANFITHPTVENNNNNFQQFERNKNLFIYNVPACCVRAFTSKNYLKQNGGEADLLSTWNLTICLNSKLNWI